MNPRAKKKWIKALESGQYRQGKGMLKKTVRGHEHFCCLGVLCDIAPKRLGKWSPEPGTKGFLYGSADEHFLPWEVMDWAGLDNSDPQIKGGGLGFFSLSQMNDSRRSFKTIAKVIREQL